MDLSRIKIPKNQSFSCEGVILIILQRNHRGFSRDFARLELFVSKIAKKAAERANIENSILLPLLIEKLFSLFPLYPPPYSERNNNRKYPSKEKEINMAWRRFIRISVYFKVHQNITHICIMRGQRAQKLFRMTLSAEFWP
jgi:hypothetical protein